MLRRRGFTVIELMVTIALAALILGVGIPMLSRWNQDRQVPLKAEVLGSDIRRLFTEAKGAGVVPDPLQETNGGSGQAANGSYQIVDGGSVVKTEALDKMTVVYESDVGGANDAMTKGRALFFLDGSGARRAGFVFKPDGTAVQQGRIILTNGNAAYEISVSTLGHVKVTQTTANATASNTPTN
ncbi:MAG: prepilin-type N-terminal cleavage/methylation domain-containing protein [Armatimonadetes bacterium]|nr:prepilin-type N-terminal cleavage/methylation domain-containing protein [Armatimonadota bacterium]